MASRFPRGPAPPPGECHGHAYGYRCGYGCSGVRGIEAILTSAATTTSAPMVVGQRLQRGALRDISAGLKTCNTAIAGNTTMLAFKLRSS